jgi:hypothetical protein
MARIIDGLGTIYSLAGTSAKMWEVSTTPPGVAMGGAVNTTTHRNVAWRTKGKKTLKELTDGSMTVAYDPACLTTLLTQVGVNQLITVTFPDESSWEFWGILDEFVPGDATDGEQPEAEITIIPTLQDNAGVEVPPEYNAPV